MKNEIYEEVLDAEETMELFAPLVEHTSKLTKDEKEEIREASNDKSVVRYLVDQYYQSQAYRIINENQLRALRQGYDNADALQYKFIERGLDNSRVNELFNKNCMDIVTDTIDVCRWMKSITGIGPVISAYLYAVFDVTKGRYNTDFLSYAGLNDNNNPWLGTDKAKKMVNEAVEYRQRKFNEIEEALKEACASNKVYTKLNKELKNIGKDFISYSEDKETKSELSHIGKILAKIADINLYDIRDIDIYNLPDYCAWLASSNHCDDILIGYIAHKTKRKFINVQKGTRNNWLRKNTKGKAPTVDDLVSYLAKPPYNTALKTKMFIIGDMFIKNSGRDKSLYGRIYKQKKLEYTMKNEDGFYADQAKEILETKNFDKGTKAYKSLIEGRLPDAQIHARARRYAVKLFISHVFEAMYYAEYREEPPKTYVIQYMGHHDYIAPEVDYRPFIDGEK